MRAPISTLCLLACAAASPFQQQTFARLPMSDVLAVPDQLLMLGDSITQFAWQNDGMAARLADQYQRKLDVVTRGFGGYTARNIRYTLPHIFTSAANIQLAIVWLGANDLVFGRSVDEYVADIRAIAEAFFETRTAHPNTRMLPCLMLVSPPPRLGVPVDRSRAYNQALVTLTAEIWERFEHRVGVTEIHDNMIVEVERSFPGSYEEQLRHFLPDGVHPNGAGYRFCTARLNEAIEAYFPHLVFTQLPEIMPGWIDPDRPSRSFPPPPQQPSCHHVLFAKPPQD